jgi:hypothetical protein
MRKIPVTIIRHLHTISLPHMAILAYRSCAIIRRAATANWKKSVRDVALNQ